jgi:linoleoyl-CoA desaturase
MKKMTPKEHLIFWATKVSYLITFFAIPILLVGPAKALIGYFIVAGTTGVSVAIVFQLAHILEETHFVNPDNKPLQLEDEWAVFQIRTTANFSTRSKVISWLLGGLNFQVEHHLFPNISHIHYPKINSILIDTCREFNVRYFEFPTLFSALRSHFKHLKSVGVA